jgi:membrane protein
MTEDVNKQPNAASRADSGAIAGIMQDFARARDAAIKLLIPYQMAWLDLERTVPMLGAVRQILFRAARFCWGVIKKYQRDDCLSYAAGLSFWLLISIVPLATLFFKLLVVLLGRQAFYQQTLETVSNVIPFIPISFLRDAVTRSREISDSMGFTWFVLLFGGYWGISQLDTSLAHVFGVRINKKLQTRKYHILRQIAILVGGLVFLAVVLALSIQGALSQYLPINQNAILTYLPILICLAATTLIFQFMTRVHVDFRHAFLGAVVTTFFWTVAKWGFKIYVDNALTWGIMYGSLLGIIAGLTFLYYSCAILLLGAEVTAAFYSRRKRREKV